MATFLLLAVGGVLLLALAAALAAAAFKRSFSPLAHLGLPATHGGRAWLLVGAMAVLALLVWLVVRAGEEKLWLPAGRGGVLLPAATLQGLAETVACRHADVVRAEARLHARGGVLRGTLQLFCRPLADAGRVCADVEALVRDQLTAATGAQVGTLAVRPRVLAVRHLKRHLS